MSIETVRVKNDLRGVYGGLSRIVSGHPSTDPSTKLDGSLTLYASKIQLKNVAQIRASLTRHMPSNSRIL